MSASIPKPVRFYASLLFKEIPGAYTRAVNIVCAVAAGVGIPLLLFRISRPSGVAVMSLDLAESLLWGIASFIAVYVVFGVLKVNYQKHESLERELDALKGQKRAYFTLIDLPDTEQRKYLRRTPDYFVKLFDGKTDKEIQSISDSEHRGKWMAFRALIGPIIWYEHTSPHWGTRKDRADLRIMKCHPSEPTIELIFNGEYRNYDYSCYEGKDVALQGRITYTGAVAITLWDCEPINSESV